MPQVESRDNFIPTDHERRVLLELIQSPQESLESIAHELKITLAALTIYLATDDAATLFAQADLANARRARTAAAAQLEQCVGALALIVRDYISDVTHNLQRETPKSRREQDRQRETTRRASTVLYRIANFTPRTLTAPVITPPNKNPTRERGVTEANIAPPTPENHPLPPSASTPPALTRPERERVGAFSPKSDIPNPKSDNPPTSEIPNPNSEITPASPSPDHQRAGLPTPHPAPTLAPRTPITISAPKRIPAPRTAARRSDIAHANHASPALTLSTSRAPP